MERPLVYLDFCSQRVPIRHAFDREKHKKRDMVRLNCIQEHGVLPDINWEAVKHEFDVYLRSFLKRPVKSIFINVEKSKVSDAVGTSTEKVGGEEIDLDKLMEADKMAVACVVHNKKLVLVATFRSDVCSEINQIAANPADNPITTTKLQAIFCVRMLAELFNPTTTETIRLAYIPNARKLTGIPSQRDQRLLMTSLQSKMLPPPQPATLDEFMATQTR